LRGILVHRRLPVTRVGMRRQKRGHSPLRLRHVHLVEHLEKISHLVRIKTHLRGVFRPQLVRLPLIITTELQKQQLQPLHGHLPHLRNLRRQNHPPDQRQLPQRLLRLLTHRMTRRHMTHLMPQHTHHLRLVVELRQDTPRQVNVPPRHRKGIHHRRIHHPHMILQVGTVRDLPHFITQLLYIILEFLVRIYPEGGQHLRIIRLPHGYLLRLRHKHDLPLPRHRIDRTRRYHHQHREEKYDFCC